MPLGSELVCWPDSLSTGAQHLTGGLGSEMGQQGQRGRRGDVGAFWLKSTRGKNPAQPADGSSSSPFLPLSVSACALGSPSFTQFTSSSTIPHKAILVLVLMLMLRCGYLLGNS
ncbi:Hypothetical predicted protein [Xyrichtys novacula]|uniref:Uncharacterized protein n=1 Tax=Xyrichtys novacula TaxID=13765 RepID=A0AAV1G5I0_XYRNO|nr:Hypothetical predicted protein [Xyrichtys novacula]